MSTLTSLRDAPPPGTAVEIAARRVSAVSVQWRGGRPVVAAHAAEPLPEGVLVPSLTAANVLDRSAVAAALGRVLDRVGSPRRVGLVLPDVVAKVSLVRFEKVPPREADLDQLVRWQVRKAAPFAIEDAIVSYVPGLQAADGREFVVAVARRAIVEEYEGLLAEAGVHAGLVDLSTFAVAAAARAGGVASDGDWLLVNVAPDYASIALMRGSDLIFFRNRSAAGEGTLGDLVHQTAMYYEDRLQGAGFARVILSGAAAASSEQARDVEQMRRSLEQRLTAPVESFDPRNAAALTDRIAAPPDLLDAMTPLVGLLLRDRGTNLASRPFYNERAVRVWLLAAAVLVAAFTLFNIGRVVAYSRSGTTLGTQSSRDEAAAADLRRQAAQLRATVDPRQIEAAAAEAHRANELIDRRTFSWTELFNRFETTLPDDVRIAAVRPKLEPRRGIVLTINVVARSVDDVSRFMKNLEQTGAFADLRPVEEHLDDDGLLDSSLETVYRPDAARPATATGGTQP